MFATTISRHLYLCVKQHLRKLFEAKSLSGCQSNCFVRIQDRLVIQELFINNPPVQQSHIYYRSLHLNTKKGVWNFNKSNYLTSVCIKGHSASGAFTTTIDNHICRKILKSVGPQTVSTSF